MLDDNFPASAVGLVDENFDVPLPRQPDPGVRVLDVVFGAQELEVGLCGEVRFDLGVGDLGELGRLPLGSGSGLADEEGGDALDEVGVLHEFAGDGVFAAEGLGDGPVGAFAELLEGNANGCGGALEDGLLGFGGPFVDLGGSCLVANSVGASDLGDSLAIEGVENLVDSVRGLETVIDGLADVAADRS